MKPTSLFYYQEDVDIKQRRVEAEQLGITDFQAYLKVCTPSIDITHCRECLTNKAEHHERMCYDKHYRRPICTACKDKLIAKHALNLTMRRQDKNEGQYRITSQQASFRDRMKNVPKYTPTPASTVGVRT